MGVGIWDPGICYCRFEVVSVDRRWWMRVEVGVGGDRWWGMGVGFGGERGEGGGEEGKLEVRVGTLWEFSTCIVKMKSQHVGLDKER